MTPEAPDRAYPRQREGAQEARLSARACSTPPAGHKGWRVRLLAERVVTLASGDAVAHETVRQGVKHTR